MSSTRCGCRNPSRAKRINHGNGGDDDEVFGGRLQIAANGAVGVHLSRSQVHLKAKRCLADVAVASRRSAAMLAAVRLHQMTACSQQLTV